MMFWMMTLIETIGVMQKSLPYEESALVHDDCDSDGTDAVESKKNGAVNLKNMFKIRMTILPL